ncbi:hypothetical protein [Streptomyces sp. NPDC097619]|uniref:hypothetical protein n=1 Tax=Streptomyces sp. NPDC097619 TaxID=3157228 RepID=UPI003319DDAD
MRIAKALALTLAGTATALVLGLGGPSTILADGPVGTTAPVTVQDGPQDDSGWQ